MSTLFLKNVQARFINPNWLVTSIDRYKEPVRLLGAVEAGLGVGAFAKSFDRGGDLGFGRGGGGDFGGGFVALGLEFGLDAGDVAGDLALERGELALEGGDLGGFGLLDLLEFGGAGGFVLGFLLDGGRGVGLQLGENGFAAGDGIELQLREARFFGSDGGLGLEDGGEGGLGGILEGAGSEERGDDAGDEALLLSRHVCMLHEMVVTGRFGCKPDGRWIRL